MQISLNYKYPLYFGSLATVSLLVFFSGIRFSAEPFQWDVKIVQGHLRIDKNLVMPQQLCLQQGIKIETKQGESGKCLLGKNSIVLGENTLVELDSAPHIFLRWGEIFIQGNKGENLRIQTKWGEIYVAGAALSINSLNCLVIKVHKEAIYFRNALGTVLVKTGEILIIKDKNTLPVAIQNTEISHCWWENLDLSLTLEIRVAKNFAFLLIHIYNNTSRPITFSPFSSEKSSFCIHIQHDEKTETIPVSTLFPFSKNAQVTIAPGKIYTIQCNVSKTMEKKGKFSFVAVYQNKSENQENQTIASPPFCFVH
jgi:hypothetical protein